MFIENKIKKILIYYIKTISSIDTNIDFLVIKKDNVYVSDILVQLQKYNKVNIKELVDLSKIKLENKFISNICINEDGNIVISVNKNALFYKYLNLSQEQTITMKKNIKIIIDNSNFYNDKNIWIKNCIYADNLARMLNYYGFYVVIEIYDNILENYIEDLLMEYKKNGYIINNNIQKKIDLINIMENINDFFVNNYEQKGKIIDIIKNNIYTYLDKMRINIKNYITTYNLENKIEEELLIMQKENKCTVHENCLYYAEDENMNILIVNDKGEYSNNLYDYVYYNNKIFINDYFKIICIRNNKCNKQKIGKHIIYKDVISNRININIYDMMDDINLFRYIMNYTNEEIDINEKRNELREIEKIINDIILILKSNQYNSEQINYKNDNISILEENIIIKLFDFNTIIKNNLKKDINIFQNYFYELCMLVKEYLYIIRNYTDELINTIKLDILYFSKLILEKSLNFIGIIPIEYN